MRNFQETAKVRHFFDICKSNVHLLAYPDKKPHPIHKGKGEGNGRKIDITIFYLFSALIILSMKSSDK